MGFLTSAGSQVQSAQFPHQVLSPDLSEVCAEELSELVGGTISACGAETNEFPVMSLRTQALHSSQSSRPAT